MGKSLTALLALGITAITLSIGAFVYGYNTHSSFSASGIWSPVFAVVIPSTRQFDVIRETQPTLFIQQKECLAYSEQRKESALLWFKQTYNVDPSVEVIIEATCEERNGSNK